MEASLYSLFTSAPYIASFFAGLLAFLSPCVLPLIPAYLSYISGVSLGSLRGDEELSSAQRWRIITASLMFIFGFGLVFVLLGASMASLVGNIFTNKWFSIIAGAIIIVFGLHIMGVINIKFLNYQARADFGDDKNAQGVWKKVLQIFAPFLLGLSFALGWTPCIGPIFGSIIMLAGQDGGAFKGVTLMVVFAVGLGLPFLLTAILTSRALKLINKLKKYFKIIEIVAGLLLILIGIAVMTGDLGTISSYFTRMLD